MLTLASAPQAQAKGAKSLAASFGKAVSGIRLGIKPSKRARTITFVLRNTGKAKQHIAVRMSCSGYSNWALADASGKVAHRFGSAKRCRVNKPLFSTVAGGAKLQFTVKLTKRAMAAIAKLRKGGIAGWAGITGVGTLRLASGAKSIGTHAVDFDSFP